LTGSGWLLAPQAVASSRHAITSAITTNTIRTFTPRP